MVRRSGLYNILLERERQDHARETKRQQVKEHKDLSTRKRRKPISVQVRILTGRTIPLVVDPHTDCLHDVKHKIQIKEGIHPDQQILLLNGNRLQEGPIRDLFIQEGTCFFLTLRNRGG